MNPAVLMKLMSAKAQFEQSHPKVISFEEGTILELTVTRPGEEPVTTNLKVKDSDLALMESLKDLMKNK